MAGCSIVMLMLLFFWPVALLAYVLTLVFTVIESIVTSVAFPAIIVCMLTGFLGFVDAVITLWRWHKDPESHALSIKAFTRTIVLYAISFIALCIACYFAGIALIGVFTATGE